MRRNKISVQRIYRNVQAAATDQGRFETSISGKKSIDDAVNALKAFKIAARPVESIRKKKSVQMMGLSRRINTADSAMRI